MFTVAPVYCGSCVSCLYLKKNQCLYRLYNSATGCADCNDAWIYDGVLTWGFRCASFTLQSNAINVSFQGAASAVEHQAVYVYRIYVFDGFICQYWYIFLRFILILVCKFLFLFFICISFRCRISVDAPTVAFQMVKMVPATVQPRLVWRIYYRSCVM